LHAFRSLYYGSDKPKPPIQKVKPRNTLLITPMMCEHTAAQIRNSTVDSMQKNDIADVSYRYLQSRRSENNTFYEVIFWTTSSFLLFKLACTINPILYLCLLAYAPHIPPNIGNTLRYKETKNYCAEWLTEKLGNDKFAEIKKLKFNKNGMFNLAALLKTENIDAIYLESKITKEDKLQCCNRDR